MDPNVVDIERVQNVRIIHMQHQAEWEKKREERRNTKKGHS